MPKTNFPHLINSESDSFTLCKLKATEHKTFIIGQIPNADAILDSCAKCVKISVLAYFENMKGELF